MFVVNLALSDLVMMTTMGPTVTINVFIQRYWVWGAFGCKLYGFVGAVCGRSKCSVNVNDIDDMEANNHWFFVSAFRRCVDPLHGGYRL